MSERNCVTHHACDCKLAEIERLKAERDELKEAFRKLNLDALAAQSKLTQAREEHKQTQMQLDAYIESHESDAGKEVGASKEMLNRLRKLEAVAEAAKALVATCKQRSIDVEYVVEGGLMGSAPRELSRVSLLDVLHRAIAALEEGK